jgi:hypothetical protein
MAGLMTRWSDVPRWAIIATIVVLIVAAYWIYKKFSSSSSSISGNSKWGSSAIAFLESQGYERETSSEAVRNYLTGQPLTPSQITLVASAIGAIGTPDVQSDPTTTGQLASTPSSGIGTLGGGSGGVGSGGTASTAPGSPYPGGGTTGATPVSYWSVPIGVAGWSTTWEGIANQFGVSPAAIQAANPQIKVSTVYGQLPTGATVKVPRS